MENLSSNMNNCIFVLKKKLGIIKCMSFKICITTAICKWYIENKVKQMFYFGFCLKYILSIIYSKWVLKHYADFTDAKISD
jgi:hypothetical protein